MESAARAILNHQTLVLLVQHVQWEVRTILPLPPLGFSGTPQKKDSHAATCWLQVLPLFSLSLWTALHVRSPGGPPP